MLIPTIEFRKGRLSIIDQRALPFDYRILELRRVDDLCDAIKALAVRGAPALGVAGAFGLLLAVEEKWSTEGRYFFDMDEMKLRSPASMPVGELQDVLEGARRRIGETRPTAVNLFWALERMRSVYSREWETAGDLLGALHGEAVSIYREDVEMCRRIGINGSALLADGDVVLTHCNTGGLATSGYGTALGVVFAAVEEGKKIRVYADETRPLLQGARLTAWECMERGIPVTVVTEGMAAYVMSRGLVSCVIVGADRIAANGDTANKIGTFSLAVIAERFKVPFYVAAPSSTIDPSIADGSAIPIEQRPEEEVKKFAGVQIAPEGARALNPAFDVTPAGLISALITEKGVHYPPYGFSAGRTE
jgi:methylthioribose-1-phosphate isomerase